MSLLPYFIGQKTVTDLPRCKQTKKLIAGEHVGWQILWPHLETITCHIVRLGVYSKLLKWPIRLSMISLTSAFHSDLIAYVFFFCYLCFSHSGLFAGLWICHTPSNIRSILPCHVCHECLLFCRSLHGSSHSLTWFRSLLKHHVSRKLFLTTFSDKVLVTYYLLSA